jgi:hypothetical protein
MNINGKELMISPASFSDAMALQKAIGRALKGTKLELPDSVTTDVSPEKLGDIIGAVLNVATSDDVEAALFACASRAVYGADREKISRDFFETLENRELYYPIMVEIIKVNIGPFFKGLVSKFAAAGALLGKSQKQ